MIKKSNILIFLCFIIAVVSIHIEDGFAKDRFPWSTYDECMKDFDIEKINLHDAKETAYLFVDYYIYRAIVENDLNECNKLPSNEKDRCQIVAEEYVRWRKLLLGIKVTTDLENRSDLSQDDRLLRDGFISAFIAKNVHFCDSITSKSKQEKCRAFIELDDKLVENPRDRMRIYFMKAIRNSNANLCNKIADLGEEGGAISQACAAIITKEIDVNNNYAIKKETKKAYCTYLDQKIKQDQDQSRRQNEKETSSKEKKHYFSWP